MVFSLFLRLSLRKRWGISDRIFPACLAPNIRLALCGGFIKLVKLAKTSDAKTCANGITLVVKVKNVVIE